MYVGRPPILIQVFEFPQLDLLLTARPQRDIMRLRKPLRNVSCPPSGISVSKLTPSPNTSTPQIFSSPCFHFGTAFNGDVGIASTHTAQTSTFLCHIWQYVPLNAPINLRSFHSTMQTRLIQISKKTTWSVTIKELGIAPQPQRGFYLPRSFCDQSGFTSTKTSSFVVFSGKSSSSDVILLIWLHRRNNAKKAQAPLGRVFSQWCGWNSTVNGEVESTYLSPRSRIAHWRYERIVVPDQGWVADAYILGITVFLIYGKLLHIFPAKWVLIAGITLFEPEVGSLMCGVGRNVGTLIAEWTASGVGCDISTDSLRGSQLNRDGTFKIWLNYYIT
ncbi:hypothetical protein B0H14DRAFT_2625936 [Mycena olivaceomarginata]|nr:hypothetical protein B0H14DRAFT_2625936 [Mycena olivaceomarginata]